MPIKLNKAQMRIKDDNGNYITAFDVLSTQPMGTYIEEQAQPYVTAAQGYASAAQGYAQEAVSCTQTGYDNLVASIASAYDDNISYKAGDYVLNNGKLYKCLYDISANNWEINKNFFEAVNISEEIKNLNYNYERVKIYTKGKRYINLSDTVTQVTMNNNIPQYSNGGSFYLGFVQCEYGDVFIINGQAGSGSGRLWGFIDTQGNILQKARASENAINKIITAPYNSAWFIVHVTNPNELIYRKKKNLFDLINFLEKYSCKPIIQFNYSNTTENNINFSWNNNYQCKITNTSPATGNARSILWSYTYNDFPKNLIPGKSYYLKYDKKEGNTTNIVRIQVIFKFPGNQLYTIYYNHSAIISIPENIQGITLALHVMQGAQPDETVSCLLIPIPEYIQRISNQNSNNICSLWGRLEDKSNSGGVTFTWNDQKTICTITGNRTSTIQFNNFWLYTDTPSFPLGIIPGNGYYLKYHSTGQKTYFSIIYYMNDTSKIYNSYTEDSYFIVPEDAQGMTVRLCVPPIGDSNETTAINQTVSFSIIPNNIKENLIFNKINKIEDSMKETNNSFNILHAFADFKNVSNYYGISYTWNEEKNICTVNGSTNNHISFRMLWSYEDGFPSVIQPGNKYLLKCAISQESTVIISIIYLLDDNSKKYETYANTTYINVPLNAVGMTIRLLIPENTTIDNVTVNIQLQKTTLMDTSTATNNEARMLVVGSSFLIGSIYPTGTTATGGTDTTHHLCSFENSPWGNIAIGLGIPEKNTVVDIRSSTGLIAPPSNDKPSILEVLLQKDLSYYDYLLTQYNTPDLGVNYPLGSLYSSAGDGTLCGGVLELLSYMRTSNPNCTLIIVGAPPSNQSEAASRDNVFTYSYGNGHSIGETNLMFHQLAVRQHFIFIDWEDLNLSYYYPELTIAQNVHAFSDDTTRAMGLYLARQCNYTTSLLKTKTIQANNQLNDYIIKSGRLNEILDKIQSKMIIDRYSKWSNNTILNGEFPARHILLPIKESDVITLRKRKQTFVYAMLKDDICDLGESPHFVNQYTIQYNEQDNIEEEYEFKLVKDGYDEPIADDRHAINSSTITFIAVPQSKYLYLTSKSVSGSILYDNLPQITINGITYNPIENNQENDSNSTIEEYDTVFFDDFDNELNTNIWERITTGVPSREHRYGNYNSRFYTNEDNAYTEQSCLVLKCFKGTCENGGNGRHVEGETANSQGIEKDNEYIAAYVSTGRKLAIPEGRISARIKISDTYGKDFPSWAFWSFGQNQTWGYAHEVDIIEGIHTFTSKQVPTGGRTFSPGSVLSTISSHIHTTDGSIIFDEVTKKYKLKDIKTAKYAQILYANNNNGQMEEDYQAYKSFDWFDMTKWHEYSVEWNQNQIATYIDGKLMRVFSASLNTIKRNGEEGFFYPQDIRFNIKASRTTTVDGCLFVDWVKVEAKKTPCISISHEDVTIEYIANPASDDIFANQYYVQPTFNTGCSNMAFSLSSSDTSVVSVSSEQNNTGQMAHCLTVKKPGSAVITMTAANEKVSNTFNVQVT